MITTTWTAPSVDLLGAGGTDVCAVGLVMAGPAAPFQGTGLPAAARLRVSVEPNERSIAPIYLPTHDGTTLGIHPSGRPQS